MTVYQAAHNEAAAKHAGTSVNERIARKAFVSVTHAAIDLSVNPKVKAAYVLATGDWMNPYTFCQSDTYRAEWGKVVAVYISGEKVVAQFKATRADFCNRCPHRRAEYLRTQKEMYQAAKAAGLDTEDRTAMIECLCALLSINITSRKQLTPGEMIRATRFFAVGAVRPGWELEDAEMLMAA